MFSVWQYKSGVRAKTVLEQPVNTALLYSVDTCSFRVCVCVLQVVAWATCQWTGWALALTGWACQEWT